jgi:hypothetical protein
MKRGELELFWPKNPISRDVVDNRHVIPHVIPIFLITWALFRSPSVDQTADQRATTAVSLGIGGQQHFHGSHENVFMTCFSWLAAEFMSFHAS